MTVSGYTHCSRHAFHTCTKIILNAHCIEVVRCGSSGVWVEGGGIPFTAPSCCSVVAKHFFHAELKKQRVVLQPEFQALWLQAYRPIFYTYISWYFPPWLACISLYIYNVYEYTNYETHIADDVSLTQSLVLSARDYMKIDFFFLCKKYISECFIVSI